MTERLSYDPKPDMLVRCIREFPRENGYGDELLPRLNRIYTVRTTFVAQIDHVVSLYLVELVNEKRAYVHRVTGAELLCEPGFNAANFLPVDPRRLDVFRSADVDVRPRVDA